MENVFRYINPLYLVAIGLAVWLYLFSIDTGKEPDLFFGFAQNNETEINLDYPVNVKRILVTEGQTVQQGMELAELAQLELNKEISDEKFQIAELRTAFNTEKSEIEGEIIALNKEKEEKVEKINGEILILEQKLSRQDDLLSGLSSLDIEPSPNNEVLTEIEALKMLRQKVQNSFASELQNKENQIQGAESNLIAGIRKHQSDVEFNQQRLDKLTLKAPHKGMIGGIHVKEGEYLPSYKSLFTLYEPNPSQVMGYVHESLLVRVNIGDKFIIRSVQNPQNEFEGSVIGLGSRIVEIPVRLRKMANLKTFGREVVLKIPEQNTLLQKEKVVIIFSESATEESNQVSQN